MCRFTLHVTLFIAILPAASILAGSPGTHRDLDWSTANRWVHIDNVDTSLESIFVASRHQWLASLTQGDSILADGRPLFWCARTDSTCTYYTFYPFSEWVGLDHRSEMAAQTNKLVTDEKVKAYDAGDTALIPPHGSQIWRHLASLDIVAPGIDSLTELTAEVGRMEFRLVDWSNWDQFEKAYTEVRDALVKERYPLVCRVFSNTLGGKQGDYLLWWLAADSASLSSAPALRDALAKNLGKDRAEYLMMQLDRYFPVRFSADAVRRPDMSNLGIPQK